jgi:hypothetical protein
MRPDPDSGFIGCESPLGTINGNSNVYGEAHLRASSTDRTA